MNRNLNVIVTKAVNRYDILLPGGFENPRLFYTNRPYTGDEEFICNVYGNEIVVPDPSPGKRPYFVVKSDNLPDAVAADRLVGLAVVENFRDQGGYRTMDGKTVKWGRFFRGGALECVTEADKAYCDAMGIRSILDYRDQHECDKVADYVSPGTVYHNVPAIRRGEDNKAAVYEKMDTWGSIASQEEADGYYREFGDLYANLPMENPSYKALFEALDHEDTVPLHQHCSAGKDRTGVGCALLLLALGMDEGTVIGDYCLSATYREEHNKTFIAEFTDLHDNPYAMELMSKIMSVEEALLRRALDAIYSKYKDFETFVKEDYGVTKERLEHWRSIHLV